ncbi:MAG: DUF3857 domain-containing protein [candidate division Zixibacteria bacterium]
MISMKKFSGMILAIILVICWCNSICWGQKFGKVESPEWEIGAPADYPEANAIILFKNGKLSVSWDKIEMARHVRIKILTQAGIDELDEFEIYLDEDDKLKNFKAHTITSDSKKHKVNKDAIFDKEVGKDKIRTFTFPALEPGCIIEYQYKIRNKRYRHLSPWFFQDDLFVLKSHLDVELSQGFSYNINYFNMPFDKRTGQEKEIPDPTKQMGTAFLKVCSWDMENLLPIKDEPYMCARKDYMAGLGFRLVSFTNRYGSTTYYSTTWGERGDDYRKYLHDDYCNQNKEVKKLAAEITSGLVNLREKSKAIYEYVAREFKTSDTPRQWFTNEKMSKLFQNKSGSSEEKNLLISELHKAVDVPSWPVLISTRKNGKFDPENVNTSQFNYLITFAQFDDGWEFLDASSKYIPYGILPSKCLTNGGLLLDGKNSSPVKMTIQPFDSYRLDLVRMYVDSDGLVTCSTESKYSGYFAASYGREFEENSQEDFLDDNYFDRLDIEYELGECSFDLDTSGMFVGEINFTSEDLIRNLDDNLLISPVQYALRNNPFKSAKRIFPVDFAFPRIYHNLIEVFVSDSVSEFILPDNILEEIDGAIFERTSKVTDSSVIIGSKLTILEPLFKPHKYASLRNLFDKVALASEDQLTAVIVKPE